MKKEQDIKNCIKQLKEADIIGDVEENILFGRLKGEFSLQEDILFKKVALLKQELCLNLVKCGTKGISWKCDNCRKFDKVFGKGKPATKKGV